MGGSKRSNLKRKIGRLEREIAAIDDMFYLVEKDGDPAQHASMLERKRDDMIRAAVLQLHTSIESILDSHIMCRMLQVPAHGRMRLMPSRRGKAHERFTDARNERFSSFASDGMAIIRLVLSI